MAMEVTMMPGNVVKNLKRRFIEFFLIVYLYNGGHSYVSNVHYRYYNYHPIAYEKA